MKNQINLVRLGEQPTLNVRMRTKMENLPMVIGQAYGAIMQHLSSISDLPADAPYTAYYNLDMNDLDVEMGFPVAERLAGTNEVLAGIIPACTAAVCMYKGAYTDMGTVYEEMSRFIEENGRKVTGIYYEYYYNSPADVPASELITKIVMPLI